MSNPWPTTETILRADGVHKSFRKGSNEVPVLRGVDLDVVRGEFLAIVGSSGSGKTTLLHLLGTLDRPDQGAIYWRGERLDNQSTTARERFRNRSCGFVFQFYHLLPELTALENVLVPRMIELGPLQYWSQKKKLTKRATELLERVGLSHRLKHRPAELSGGEMQRTAIARALLSEPEILLADEPTGNLDAETGQNIFELLNELREEARLTLVLVTHDISLANRADRTCRLAQGVLATSQTEFRPRATIFAG
jgi:lipoprotein-releasing system ATP-binding protein